MNPSILVENLAKRFENVEAVSGISFSVGKGELFGFLGPNGAGKTTPINMLTGRARPDALFLQNYGLGKTRPPGQIMPAIRQTAMPSSKTPATI
ncbi:MAG: ATP-binding cassette domain-containing protein [Desulfobacterales bacterium]|nr:ATP-binding cassette domain-containing protein [Desulfobacterales bacterium]